MGLTAVPVTLREANKFVEQFHRHNGRTARDGGKYAIGVSTGDALVGVAIVGRPLARLLDDGWTAEVLRTCTNGDAPKGTNSFLYGACWRAWRAMGGRKLITYTLTTESGYRCAGPGGLSWRSASPVPAGTGRSWAECATGNRFTDKPNFDGRSPDMELTHRQSHAERLLNALRAHPEGLTHHETAVVEIPLRNLNRVVLVDAVDAPIASAFNWYGERHHKTYYARSSKQVNGKRQRFFMHRLLTQAPSGTLVDHRNRNGLDNRRENLRICNASQSAINRSTPRRTSQFRGVSGKDGRWSVQITAQRRRICVGTFTDERAAAMAYDTFARAIHGEFAQLNFPEDRA